MSSTSKVAFRRIDLSNRNEVQIIAEIDVSIPAMFDPVFKANEKAIFDRFEQLMKCGPHDFFDLAVNHDGKIVGYHFLKQSSSPHGVRSANIDTLWVDIEYRRLGIAKTLKERGEMWAREQNLDHISTFVHSRNSSMLALNEHLDYELVGYKLKKKLT